MDQYSQGLMEAFREEQRQAFYDLADECRKCGKLYIDVCVCTMPRVQKEPPLS